MWIDISIVIPEPFCHKGTELSNDLPMLNPNMYI